MRWAQLCLKRVDCLSELQWKQGDAQSVVLHLTDLLALHYIEPDDVKGTLSLLNDNDRLEVVVSELSMVAFIIIVF